jgi:predicted dehydrogenase
MNKHKALIIGCGNIGAMYDFDSEAVLTHAKAFSCHPDIDFEVFDIDPAQSKKVAKRYHTKAINKIDSSVLADYDMVSIASSTAFHVDYLSMCFEAKVAVVICEKPISLSKEELLKVQKEYDKSDTKVLVNYFRRFQPSYLELKKAIQNNVKNESLKGISVRYHRGFINNASHAVDTINFLLDNTIEFKETNIFSHSYDHFEKDPTLSLFGKTNTSSINFYGVENLYYPTFEIDLFFDSTHISLLNGGKEISIRKGNEITYKNEDTFDRYMCPVVDAGLQLLQKRTDNDNFQSAMMTNHDMLSILETL